MSAAADQLTAFAKRFGAAGHELAVHAALPLVLTPDLLYRLWANFVPQAPWTAVSDLLLSDLCHDIGGEVYELSRPVRALLIEELRQEYGAGRVAELAHFLALYAAQTSPDGAGAAPDLIQTHRWAALAYVEPGAVAAELAATFNERVAAAAGPQILRLGHIIDSLADSLPEFQPLQLIAQRAVAAEQERQAAAAAAAAPQTAPPPDSDVAAALDPELNALHAALAQVAQATTAPAQAEGLTAAAEAAAAILEQAPGYSAVLTLTEYIAARQEALAPFTAAAAERAKMLPRQQAVALQTLLLDMIADEQLPLSNVVRQLSRDLLLNLSAAQKIDHLRDTLRRNTVDSTAVGWRGTAEQWCQNLLFGLVEQLLRRRDNTIQVAPIELRVLPGSSVTAAAQLVNPGLDDTAYSLICRGVPETWFRSGVPRVNVPATAQPVTVELTFQPPIDAPSTPFTGQLLQIEVLDKDGSACGAATLRLHVGLPVGRLETAASNSGLPRHIELTPPDMKIGCAVDMDIILDGDEAISPHHATILLSRAQIEIEDTGSAGGTFVDDMPLTPYSPVPLEDGQLIRIGSARFRFYCSPLPADAAADDQLYTAVGTSVGGDTALDDSAPGEEVGLEDLLIQAQQSFRAAALQGQALNQMAELETAARIITGILAVAPDMTAAQMLQAEIETQKQTLQAFADVESTWSELDEAGRGLAAYRQLRRLILTGSLPVDAWLRQATQELLLAIAQNPDLDDNETVQTIRAEMLQRTQRWAESLLLAYMDTWLSAHNGSITLPETELRMQAGNLVEYEVVIRRRPATPGPYRLAVGGLSKKWYTIAGGDFELNADGPTRLYVDINPPLDGRGEPGGQLVQFRLLDGSGALAAAADMRLFVNPERGPGDSGFLDEPESEARPEPIAVAPAAPAPAPASNVSPAPVPLRRKLNAKVLIGETVARHQLLKLLDENAVRITYQARSMQTGREMRLSVILPELATQPGFYETFAEQMSKLAGLDHPNILRVLDFGQADGLIYFLETYFEGETLQDWLAQAGGGAELPVMDVISIFTQLAAGLAFMHQMGVIHGSFTPGQTLLLPREGTESIPKIMQPGLSRLVQMAQLETQDFFFGSPAHMAPEQLMGRPVTDRSDIYALGVMLFEALTGRQPHSAATVFDAVKYFMENADAPPPAAGTYRADVPSDLDEMMGHMLAHDSANRPAATVINGTLSRLAVSSAIAATPEPPPAAAPAVAAPGPAPAVGAATTADSGEQPVPLQPPPVKDPRAAQRLGTRLDHYFLEAVAGQGAIATVYRARDENLKRLVAIKIMHPHLSREEIFRQRFFQEARNMAAVNHPNLVRVFDVVQANEEVPYLVYEFMAGGTLRQRLQEVKQLPLTAESYENLAQLGDGLGALHRGGVVTRELAPENIMFTGDGVPKITGSTLSKSLTGSQNLTRSGEIVGTLAYMAPEQLLQDSPTSTQTDMYGFGAVLYECFAGRPFMEGKVLGDIARFHSEGRYTPLNMVRPEVPDVLNELVMSLLSANPNDRPDANAVSAQLRTLALITPSAAAAPEPKPAPAKPAPPAGFRLQVTRNDVPIDSFPLTEGTAYVIGRRAPADIVLSDQRVSRRHCEIKMEEGHVLIRDLGSTNGTFGNQFRLEANKTFRWQPGQVVTVGEHKLSLAPLV